MTTQTWATDFGEGYNQLDSLSVEADDYALHIGIGGAFEFGANTVILLMDVDYWEGTGFGADDTTLADTDGAVETVLSSMPYTSGIDGMGFDAAWVSIQGQELELGDMDDLTGLRGLADPWVNDPSDLWWLLGVSNFDDGNRSEEGEPAADAGTTGDTEDGYEVQIPWYSLYPEGIPPEGLSMAMAVVLCNSDCSVVSNQALPPLPDSMAPDGEVAITSVVRLDVDATGAQTAPAYVTP